MKTPQNDQKRQIYLAKTPIKKKSRAPRRHSLPHHFNQSGNSRFCSCHRRKKNPNKNRADARKTKKTPKSTKTPPKNNKNTKKHPKKHQFFFPALTREKKTSRVKKKKNLFPIPAKFHETKKIPALAAWAGFSCVILPLLHFPLPQTTPKTAISPFFQKAKPASSTEKKTRNQPPLLRPPFLLAKQNGIGAIRNRARSCV